MLPEQMNVMCSGSDTSDTEHLAEISLALFGGLGVDRLVDPTAVTETTLDTALSLLYDALVGPDPSR